MPVFIPTHGRCCYRVKFKDGNNVVYPNLYFSSKFQISMRHIPFRYSSVQHLHQKQNFLDYPYASRSCGSSSYYSINIAWDSSKCVNYCIHLKEKATNKPHTFNFFCLPLKWCHVVQTSIISYSGHIINFHRKICV